MRGFKTEGIILKRKNFGEADRILTVFTILKGKISVIAKGVRRVTSRRSGNVELLNRVSMYLYQAKGMPVLTEAESLQNFEKLKQDLTLSTVAFHIIELVDRLSAENQEDRILYFNLSEVLKRLERSPRQILIRAFEVKILSHLGFMSFQNPEVQLHFHPAGAGSFHPGGGSEEVLKKLESYSWDEIENLKINQKQAMELERVLRYHLERVIEGSLKSRKLFKRI